MSVVVPLGVAAIACVLVTWVAYLLFVQGWEARSRLDGPGDLEPPVPLWMGGVIGLGLVLLLLAVLTALGGG